MVVLELRFSFVVLYEHVQIYEKYCLQFVDNIIHIWVMYSIDGVEKYFSNLVSNKGSAGHPK
jgi:hypothetical protein